jgi:hypothetical protein
MLSLRSLQSRRDRFLGCTFPHPIPESTEAASQSGKLMFAPELFLFKVAKSSLRQESELKLQ